MSYEFKRLSDVEVVAEPAESANVLIEENGVIKKASKDAVGGATSWNDLTDKPFYTGEPAETVLFEGVVENEAAINIELVADKQYTVIFDDVEYVLTAKADGEWVYIGSDTMWWDEDYDDTEPPFCMGSGEGEGWFYTVDDENQHTMKITAVIAPIHTLDEKYLPKMTYDNVGALSGKTLFKMLNGYNLNIYNGAKLAEIQRVLQLCAMPVVTVDHGYVGVAHEINKRYNIEDGSELNITVYT
jgi:hypothetical protein